MLQFNQILKFGRDARDDDLPSFGKPTQAYLKEAAIAGNFERVDALSDHMIAESKPLHDLFCDWLWNLFTKIADKHGETEMFRLMKESQATWMMKRTWKAFLRMNVEQRVEATAEVMRSHRCGPDQDGTVDIIEEDDRYTIRMDPCGSGGRMRRGDAADGTASRLGSPYNFGTTKEAHTWSWGQKDVPYYCIHCCVNEILAIEMGGYPLWVTGYDPDPQKPCAWHFYKNANAIPMEYFERIGYKKPDAGAY